MKLNFSKSKSNKNFKSLENDGQVEKIKFALVGNPNCGKSTLFTTLTGIYQKVGNWTGVTVSQKEGKYQKDNGISIVDFPGLYSTQAISLDEKIVTDELKKSPPSVIINVVDGTNLERNLFLTVQLTSLNIPVVMAVNMADRLEKNGVVINYSKLSSMLGVPVIPVSALKNKNVDALISLAKKTTKPPKNLIEKNSLMSSKDIYSFVHKMLKSALKNKVTKAEIFTQKADKILTHKIWGLPIFIFVLTLIYYLSSKVGGGLGGLIENGLDLLNLSLQNWLINIRAPEWLIGLICGAIINGLSGVLAFLPQILIIFFLLGILEQSGYASRVCFITDRLLKRIGIGGKSLIPLTLSCGCTVTGLMATRTIEDDDERTRTIYLAPFMPCGAKMVVFGWFSQVFFNGNPLVSVSFYFLSIVTVCVGGVLLNHFNKQGGGTFILEMPTLTFPTIKGIWAIMREKVKEFLKKAGTVIFALSIMLWVLLNFGFKGYTYGATEQSFLYGLGNILKYVFIPLGFGNWQATVAVLSGVMAKEAVIETLKIVCATPSLLFDTRFSAYAFLTFVLLSCPCVASIAQARRELGSRKKVAVMLVLEFLVAYLTALIINSVGYAYTYNKNLLFTAIVVIIFVVGVKHTFKRLLKNSCKHCGLCNGSDKKCKEKRNTTI